MSDVVYKTTCVAQHVLHVYAVRFTVVGRRNQRITKEKSRGTAENP